MPQLQHIPATPIPRGGAQLLPEAATAGVNAFLQARGQKQKQQQIDAAIAHRDALEKQAERDGVNNIASKYWSLKIANPGANIDGFGRLVVNELNRVHGTNISVEEFLASGTEGQPGVLKYVINKRVELNDDPAFHLLSRPKQKQLYIEDIPKVAQQVPEFMKRYDKAIERALDQDRKAHAEATKTVVTEAAIVEATTTPGQPEGLSPAQVAAQQTVANLRETEQAIVTGAAETKLAKVQAQQLAQIETERRGATRAQVAADIKRDEKISTLSLTDTAIQARQAGFTNTRAFTEVSRVRANANKGLVAGSSITALGAVWDKAIAAASDKEIKAALEKASIEWLNSPHIQAQLRGIPQ